MKAFILWFVEEFPPVLLKPPISMFVGLAFLVFTIGLFYRILHLRF